MRTILFSLYKNINFHFHEDKIGKTSKNDFLFSKKNVFFFILERGGKHIISLSSFQRERESSTERN